MREKNESFAPVGRGESEQNDHGLGRGSEDASVIQSSRRLRDEHVPAGQDDRREKARSRRKKIFRKVHLEKSVRYARGSVFTGGSFMASKRTVLRRRRVRLGGRVKSARRGKSFRRRVFQKSRTLSALAADDERVLLVEIDF